MRKEMSLSTPTILGCFFITMSIRKRPVPHPTSRVLSEPPKTILSIRSRPSLTRQALPNGETYHASYWAAFIILVLFEGKFSKTPTYTQVDVGVILKLSEKGMILLSKENICSDVSGPVVGNSIKNIGPNIC